MFLKVIFAVFLCGMHSCSVTAQETLTIGDDKANWEAVWNHWNETKNQTDVSRSDDDENVFEKIVRINAEERGGGVGRSDDNVFLFEGDIKMNKSEAINIIQGKGTSRQRRAVIKTRNKLWPRNVPYAIDGSLNGVKSYIKNAIKEWENTLDCLGNWRDVTYQTKPRDYMYFFRGGGCYSQVGRVGGAQRVSIGNNCHYHGIVVHEIGHAMGLWHEQSRPDRDSYVTILWNNIIPATKFNFQKHSTSTIDSRGVPYDYDSVMHYGSYAFSRYRGQKTIESIPPGKRLGQRNGLSEKDKKQVRLLYRCGTTTTKPTLKTTIKPTVRPTINPSGCHDKETASNCQDWKKLGYCTKQFVGFMRINCCKTCAFDCKDVQSAGDCQYWKQLGYCKKTFVDYMKKNCCKTCASVASCTDLNTSGYCPSWANDGYCNSKTYGTFMKSNCAKSCGC